MDTTNNKRTIGEDDKIVVSKYTDRTREMRFALSYKVR